MNRKDKIRYKEWIIIILAWVVVYNGFSWYILTNFEMFFEVAEIEKLIE